MKNERLLDKMNLLDDKYINEANPQIKKRKRINFLKIGALAACICLIVTAFNIFLFIPLKSTAPDVSQYKDNEYFPIIEKMNELSAPKPEYKNNFQRIMSCFSSIIGIFEKNGAIDFDNVIVGGAPNDSPDEEYNEITDNQVNGVTEGDIIKRSNKYIYYLSNRILKVYSIAQEGSEKVGEFDLSYIQKENEYGKPEEISLYTYNSEMYLSSDCETVTIIGTGGHKTRIISLDVSNVGSITLKSYASVEGNYHTSRMINGKLLVITNTFCEDVDFSNEETFVPSVSYDSDSETTLVPMDKIVCAENLTIKHYTVASLFDERTLSLKGCASFLSFTNDLYITDSTIYASRSYSKEFTNAVSLKRKTVTEIACISYCDEGFDIKGSINVDGYIKDRYSFDEYEEILRVISTTSVSTVNQNIFTGDKSFITTKDDGTSASLYCIDLARWEIVASVEDFAPKGESVQSVRFDKNYAYVCTAIELTDPVFFFDLSDLSNITYKETGNIDGFSTSLINLDNGYLLGIGRGNDWSNVKVEIYKEVQNKVESICSYEIKSATYSTDYKCYYVNRDTNMFGFGYCDYNSTFNYYALLQFSNGELLELVNIPFKSSLDNMRSVYIDGYLYIFGENDFKVVKI